MLNAVTTGRTERRRITGKLGLLFLLMMTILTFFSKTINNITLPRVEVTRPAAGALVKEIFGEGTLEAKFCWEEYAKSPLRVKEVLVGLGDQVSKGQPILILDIDDLKSAYLDERARLRELELSLAEAEMECVQKERDYRNVELLYELGAAAKVALQDAEKALADAERKRDTILLNVEVQTRKLQDLAAQVGNDGVYVSPGSGVVVGLSFDKGDMTNSSQPLFRIADPTQGFRPIVPVANDLADYVRPGDTVNFNIPALGDRRGTGEVERIVDNKEQPREKKDIWVDMSLDGLAGGERGLIYLSKKTKQYRTLVPNSAVYEDTNGFYVFTVQERKGPLGTEHYVQKMYVNVEDSDNTKSALTDFVMGEVVVQSSKPISEGDRVLKEAVL